MARRGSARSHGRAQCDGHKQYRSEFEAAAAMAWHPVTACTRCRSGKVWHVFRCGDHVHVGHKSVQALAMGA